MKRVSFAFFFSYCLFFISVPVFGQKRIQIDAILHPNKDLLTIQQEITYTNTTSKPLQVIYLHNWTNGFKDNTTPLAQRFIENYDKSLYFAKEKNRGQSTIHNIAVNFISVPFQELPKQQDIVRIPLTDPLAPQETLVITATYTLKIPHAKFTGYGKTATGYHLRHWYLSPAVYRHGKWQLMSHLNMDDLFMEPADYTVNIEVPRAYFIESNLYTYETVSDTTKNYYLVGKNKLDVLLSINTAPQFKELKTKNTLVKTSLLPKNINPKIGEELATRELDFIATYLGKYPHVELVIDPASFRKNSIQNLIKIPKILNPYDAVFKCDVLLFKAISKKYIEDILIFNKRTDYWLSEGLQTFLLMEYIQKYYPEATLLGSLSKIWGVNTYNFAKLHFNDKFLLTYQFSARKFLDQPLTTKADSLSNFNRETISKYKAALGLRYLQDYVGSSALKAAFKDFYFQNRLQITNSSLFEEVLKSKTSKEVTWFFEDYIHTSKKIDYTIEKVVVLPNDSIAVTLKNKRNITAPVALYGIKDKKILFKQWVPNIDSTQTIFIKKGNFDKLSLNYEQLYPEYNSIDNWKNIKKNIFTKPIKLKLFKDLEDPYYHQINYQPVVKYNYYDGVLLGLKLNNKPFLKHNLELSIAPTFALKSNAFTGRFNAVYNQYFEKGTLYKIKYGASGSNFHYAPNLSYTSFSPYTVFQFRRENLRKAGGKALVASLVHINKEVPNDVVKTDQDNYSVGYLKYVCNQPEIIHNLNYSVTAEFGTQFTKLSTDIRYRKLNTKNRSFDLRFFGGVFISNQTTSDYFNFGLQRGSDYLFQQQYLGRSETAGVLTQQFILSDGGFKSFEQTAYANQFLFATNASLGLWKWLEFYNSAAVYKSKQQPIHFAYENGIRFNFVPKIFELYFPLYNNQGWEVNQPAYPSKIRFTLTTDFRSIFSFFRKGFL